MIVMEIMIFTTRSWSNPDSQEGRANPNFKPEKGQPSHRERSPTPTQEKEGPNNPSEGKANPFLTSGKGIFINICIKIQIIIIMSLPILPKGVGSGLSLLLLLRQAWPSPSRSGLAPHLPFLLAGPLAFPFSPFWLGLAFSSFGSGLANPDPEKEGPTLTPRMKGRPAPKGQPRGPTVTRRANPCLIFIFSTVGDNYHCVIVQPQLRPTLTPRKKSNLYPREGRAKQPKRRKGQSPSQEWEGHICQYLQE